MKFVRKDNGRDRTRFQGAFWSVFLVAVLTVMGGAFAVAQDGKTPNSSPSKPDSFKPATAELSVSDLKMDVDSPTVRLGTVGDSMFSDSLIVPPTTNEAKTVRSAVELAVNRANKRLVFLSTNVLDQLEIPYKQPFSGRAELRDILSRILPYEFAAYEQPIQQDEQAGIQYVFVGTRDDVNKKTTAYASEVLANNHVKIEFSTTSRGMSLYDAVIQVREDSGANIVTMYMDPADQGTEFTEGTNAVAGIEQFSGTNTYKSNRVVFSTPYKMEWRTVLFSFLDPCEYAFDEIKGVVRVAKKTKFDAMKKAELNARPMVTKVVRVYHANPNDIVAKLALLNVTASANAKILVAPYQEKVVASTGILEGSDTSYRKGMASSSSTITTGAGSGSGDTGSGAGSAWGDLLRPKNPPGIVIHDIEENVDKIEMLIRSMDVREKQVLIEALILDLSDSATKKIGMDFENLGFNSLQLGGVTLLGAKEHITLGTSENSYDWNGTADRTYSKSAGQNSLSKTFTETSKDVGDNYYQSKRNKGSYFGGFYGPLDFNFILQLVEEDGDSRVLSSPVLTIGDHSESMIHVGEVTPVADIETTDDPNAENESRTVSVEWREIVTGLLLWVGPEITEDGEHVRLWVHPRITDLTGEKVTVGGTSYPNMVATEMDTRVTVPSSSTLMLGGLTRIKEEETIKKVPVLGDIPLLGRLFRFHSNVKRRRNLVILIRPTILDQDTPETGFEKPTLIITDPMMSTSGRNFVARDIGSNDKMREREKNILKKFSDRNDQKSGVEQTIGSDAAADSGATGDTEEQEIPESIETVTEGK